MEFPSADHHRVLFVDDCSESTDRLKHELSQEPFTVLSAGSADEAIDILGRECVDVVVSDELSAGMSGTQLLTRVRVMHPDTVRLMLAGPSSIAEVADAVNKAAVHRLLLKPCTAIDLAGSIEKALAERNEHRIFELWKSSAAKHSAAELNASLDRALDSLWMAYQPIVRAADAQIFAHEALLRTRDAAIPHPEALLDAAERTGRMTQVDARIFDLVAASIHQAPANTAVLVNVHPHTLESGMLLDANNPLHPHSERVFIEVTERSALEDTDVLKATTDALRSLGYRIALDDMGAGYAGLTSFALLVPEIVKFDMDLVRDLDQCPAKRKLIGAMTGLCAELGIETVAEGVETYGERMHAEELGCDLLQGFYFGRPQAEFRHVLDGPRRAVA